MQCGALHGWAGLLLHCRQIKPNKTHDGQVPCPTGRELEKMSPRLFPALQLCFFRRREGRLARGMWSSQRSLLACCFPRGKAKQTGDEKPVMPSPSSEECLAYHTTTFFVCGWVGGEKNKDHSKPSAPVIPCCVKIW